MIEQNSNQQMNNITQIIASKQTKMSSNFLNNESKCFFPKCNNKIENPNKICQDCVAIKIFLDNDIKFFSFCKQHSSHKKTHGDAMDCFAKELYEKRIFFSTFKTFDGLKNAISDFLNSDEPNRTITVNNFEVIVIALTAKQKTTFPSIVSMISI
jgi:hypothetical protein